jgi:Ca2+-binding RTX toxin-like protein
LGLSSVAGLNNWVAAQLTGAGSTAAAKGAKLVSMLNDFAMMTADATYGSYAKTFNDNTAASLTNSQTAKSAAGAFGTSAKVAADAAAAEKAAAEKAAADKAAADKAAADKVAAAEKAAADKVIADKAAADKAAADKIIADKAAADAAEKAAKSLPLTTGSDSLIGGSGDDTFTGAVSATNLQTLTGGDKLDGGAGTDTLSVILNAGYTVTPGSLKNIEVLEVTTVSSNSGIDLANSSGLTTVNVLGSTANTTLANLPGSSIATNLTGNTGTVTIGFLPAVVAGTADSLTINVANQTGAVSIDSGIETVTVNALPGSSSSGLGLGNTTLKATGGDSNTSLGLGTVTSRSIDASAYKGATFSVTTSGTAAAVTGGDGSDTVSLSNTTGSAAHVVTTGAGDDTITVGTATSSSVQVYASAAGSTSISAGGGTDSITFAGNYDSSDTIDGGEGTDTLTFRVATDLTGVSTVQTNVTSIERLAVSDSSAANNKVNGFALRNFGTGVTGLTITDYTTTLSTTSGTGNGEDLYDTGTFAFNPGASTLTLNGLLNSNITFSADGNAATDSLTLSLTNYTSGATVVSTGSSPTITSTGIETLTVTSNTRTAAGTYNTFGNISPTGSGGADVTVNFRGFSVATGSINAKTINASGLTSQSAADAGLVMGSASSSVTGQTITGSGTQDTLYGGGGNDVISGGAGNDVIYAGSGVDSINGGAGNDTIHFASSGDFATTDSIDGGDGTDKLSLLDADALAISSGTTTVSNISNIETLALSNAAVNSVNVTRFGGLSNLEFTAGVNGSPTYSNLVGPVTVTYVGAATTAATDTVTASLRTDSGADTLTVNLVPTGTATNDFGNLSGANFETVTINASRASGNTTSTAALLDLTNTSGTTAVTVSGATTLTAVISSTVLASFDASTNTAGVNATMTASTVAMTATGTAAADTLVSGAGADNISGGDGNDSITSGAGADTINGGGGDDTLDGGAGADSISGGAGTDSLITSAGNDTLDGGDGSDTLTISSAAYTNISGYTLAGIETLNANSLAFTSTTSQFQGITTFTNASAVTFTDAGTITGKSGVTSHTLADGTNTMTVFGGAAANQSVLGGTGADTINIASAFLDVNDVITGGSGFDTVNVTGNTASAATTWIDGISGVETITFANTTNSISISPVTAVAGTSTLTIDTTAMTSGRLTFSGANETNGGTFIVSAGAGADTITGGDGADSIYGGFGADSITGGSGIDVLDLGSGDAAIDTVVLGVANSSRDVIYAFNAGATNGDLLKVVSGISNNTAHGATAAVTGDLATLAGAVGNSTLAAGKFIYKITGTAAGLATTGTDLLTLLGGTITTQNAADRIYFAISDGTDVGIYYGTPGGDTSLVAAEILLVGIIKATTLASVTFDNFTFAA